MRSWARPLYLWMAAGAFLFGLYTFFGVATSATMMTSNGVRVVHLLAVLPALAAVAASAVVGALLGLLVGALVSIARYALLRMK